MEKRLRAATTKKQYRRKRQEIIQIRKHDNMNVATLGKQPQQSLRHDVNNGKPRARALHLMEDTRRAAALVEITSTKIM